MDGAGGGTAIFFGMMLAGLFYLLAHMNFHLLATKITGRTDPSKTTRVWAHVAAILTALATLAGAGYLEYLSLVGKMMGKQNVTWRVRQYAIPTT